MTHSDAPKTDIYTRITNQIITSLEQGVKPWTQPWSIPHKDGPVSRPLRHNGEPYSGINVLTLWASAMGGGFASPTWMTFKQALELGGAVRKGEKGSPVVYASSLKRTEHDAQSGQDVERDIPYMKAYTVFNIEQIDGLPERYQAPLETLTINSDRRIIEAEAFFSATGAQIDHQGHRAYYAPGPDQIVLPRFEVFRDAESYYATLGHECIHWTRHKSRLDRDFGQKRFGDSAYAREELVAEIGAAFLCADLKISVEDRGDHAAYIEHWLKVLRDDKRAIFSAAAHAERACKFLHELQTERREAAA
jgi:antirestriction protein ArdC